MNIGSRNLLTILFAFILVLFSTKTVKADHNVAIDLTYTCVDPATNTYRFRLVFYRDCSGIPAPGSTTLQASNVCGLTIPNVPLALVSSTEVSQLCDNSFSTCNGGTLTGIEEYVYEGTATIPSGCNQVTFSYSICCRALGITNLSSLGSTYVETVINTNHPDWVGSCNNSPQFSGIPILYTCAGQQTTYSPGAVDPDADSLSFSIAEPLGGGGTPISFAAPGSIAEPLNTGGTFSIDPLTGQMTFTPVTGQFQYAVIGVVIEEWRNGLLLGRTIREVTIVVQQGCTNNIATIDTIRSNDPAFSVVGQSVEICRGKTTSFSIEITDPDLSDTLNITTNFTNAPINGVIDSIVGTNPATIYFTVNTNTLLPGTYPFSVNASDGACPVPGVQSAGFLLTVAGVRYSRTTFCTLDPDPHPTIFAGASGGVFQVVAGTPSVDSLIIDTNTGVIDISGSSIGSYTVIYTTSVGACPGTDSIDINIAGSPDPSFAYDSLVYCDDEVNPFPTITGVPGGYFASTTNVNFVNPLTGEVDLAASPLDTHNITYAVRIGSCVSLDSVPLIITRTTFDYGSGIFCTNDIDPTPTILGPNGTFSVIRLGGSVGTLVMNATTGTIDLSASNPGSYRIYYTTVTGECPGTDSFDITVNQAPDASFAYTNPIFCKGNANPFPTVSGTPGGTFSGNNIVFGNFTLGNIILNQSSSGTHDILYTVTQNGCTDVDTSTIEITELVDLDVIASELFICFNQSDTLQFQATPIYNGPSLVSGANYTWVDSTNLSSGSIANPIAFLSDPEIFTIYYNDGLCPEIQSGIEITAPYPTVLNPIPDVTLCGGGSAQLEATLQPVADTALGYTDFTSRTITAPILPQTTDTTFATLNVSGFTPGTLSTVNISGMRVCLNLNLSLVSHLDVYLIDPCGNQARLFGPGAAGQSTSLSDVCFTPAASGIMNVPPFPLPATVPASSSYEPWGNFNNFFACNANGTWQLMLIHNTTASIGGVNGTLLSWSLLLNNPTTTSFNWEPNYNISCTDCTDPIVSPTVDTQYTVYVQNLFGCGDTATVNVFVDTALAAPIVTCDTLTASSVQFRWNLQSGVANYSVSINGGTSFLLPGSQTSYTVTGLSQGQCASIDIQAISNGGSCPNSPISNHSCCALFCPVIDPVSITVLGNNPLCQGDTLLLDAGSGTSYLWSNSDSTQQSSVANAGNYSVTVTDALGCIDTGSIVINVVPKPTPAIVASGPVSMCNGSSVNLDAGSGYSSYSWFPAGNTQVITATFDLMYKVSVTDANGCIGEDSIDVTIGTPVIATLDTLIDVSCFGADDGLISVIASGGFGGYTYSWNPSGQTAATATGLDEGPYSVTITDMFGCSTTYRDTISEPNPLAVFTSSSAATCAGIPDGSATVSINGGTPGYNVSWGSNANNQSSLTAIGLTSGTYTVTVTDANACSDISTITVTQPSNLNATVSIISDYNGQDISCYGACDAEMTVLASGGSPSLTTGYDYVWTDGQDTDTATGLCAGNFSVTVTDSLGCFVVAGDSIIQPDSLIMTLDTAIDVSCNGSNDGTATVIVTGGTSSFTYGWDDPTFQTTATATGLAANTYMVTVGDVNGCSDTISVAIADPPVLSLVIVADTVSCFGGSDGEAISTASGGTAGYTYQWDDANSQTTAIATGLAAGVYCVTVTDASGCTATSCVTITEPSAMTVTAATTQISCFGEEDGAIDVDVQGGTPGYSYAWSNGTFTEDISDLGAGVYSLTATDANGCTATVSTTISEPAQIITTIGVVSNYNGADISCEGASDGAVQVIAAGGSPGFTYQWSDANSQTTAIASGLAQGTYDVTITDAAGCSVTDNVTLTQPIALQANELHVDLFCNSDCDGQIIVNAVSGTGTLGINGYEYRIVGPGQTGNVFSSNNNFLGLCAGTYTVEVRDGNNCVLPVSITLTEPPVLAASATGTDASCNGAADGTATVTATGGVAPYSYSWPGGLSGNPVTGLAAGGYDVTVTDANGCDVVTSVVINEPTALTATVTFTEPSCNNGGNATATATPSGGTAPYSYFWSNGQNGQTAIGYTAGTHTVTISDANNCQIVRNVTITQPAALTVSITGTNLNCSGNGSGTATATPTGGTGPYTYQWSNNQTTQTATGLSQGVVSVIVTDANNCQALATTTLTQPNPLQVSLVSTTNATCNGAADGSATVTASGGSAPYTYNWSNGQAGATATGLTAGIYTASVTDNSGCTQTIQVNITEPNAISIDQINTTMVSCKGGSDGTASAFISGGTAPYTFSWSNGGNTQQLTGLTAGTYNLTLTDANGCSTTSTVIVNEPAQALTGVINTQGTLCSGGATGQLTAVISGGTLTSPDYNYQWSNGATTPVVSGLTAGTYSVTVTDDNGCTLSLSATVGSGGTIAINSLTNTDVTCEGGNDGTANVAASGGSGTLIYNWSNGQAGTVATGLSAGTYYISITDNNGCTRVDSVTVQDGPEIIINTNISDANCFGESSGTLTVTNAANFGSISWNDPQLQVGAQASNLAAGQYTVTVVTLAGCPATETYTVGQPDELLADLTVVSTVLCTDDSTGALSVSPQGGTGSYSFSWSNGGNNNSIAGLGAGSYSVTVSDANGCTATDSEPLGNPDPLSLDAQGQAVICVGDNDGNIVVSGIGGTARLGSYEFSIDSSNWQAGNLFPNLTAGIYNVYVRDNNGCVAETIVNIDAADPFFITSLLPGDTTIEYGDTIVLEADVNDPTGAVVNWIDVSSQDTIIDSTSTSAYVITQFPANRTIYRFVAVSPAGCVADTSMIVDVNKTRVVGAARGFTPNRDGANDRFFIQANRKVTKVTTFRVYDRWGELVFENSNFQPNDPLEGWDGTFQGKPMNSAVFAWYAEMEFIDGETQLIRGEVTLLR